MQRGLTKGKLLGKGTSGRVYSAKSPNGTEYAVKRGIALRGSDFFVGARELDMTTKSLHPCVIELRKVTEGNPFHNALMSPLMDEEVVFKNGRTVKVETPTKVYRDDTIHLVFSLAQGGNLYQFRKGRIFWTHHDTRRIMAELLVGLEYIHSMNILHRDIKPENILLKEEEIPDVFATMLGVSMPGPSSQSSPSTVLRVKLADFGLAKPSCRFLPQTPKITTCWYRAPEVSIGITNYDARIDIWSAGCIMYELFTGDTFNGKKITENDTELLQGIISSLPYIVTRQLVSNMDSRNQFRDIVYPMKPIGMGEFLRLYNRETQKYCTPEEVTKKMESDPSLRDFTELLLNMLQFDHNRRLTASQALAHRYFDPIRPYIDFLRSLRPPAPMEFPPVELLFTIERKWMMEMANEYYRDRLKHSRWYTDRIFFQAIDICDRILIKGKPFINPKIIVTEDLGQLLTKTVCRLYFVASLHFAFKYFASLTALSLSELMPRELNTPANLGRVAKLEPILVNQTLAYDIYHDTVYDVLCRNRPPQDGDAYSILRFIEAGHHNGKTPQEAYEFWNQNRKLYYP